MTREEAREALSVLKIYDAQWLREAVDMAIEALTLLQDENLIRRGDALEAACNHCYWAGSCGVGPDDECEMENALNAVPAVYKDDYCSYGERRRAEK